MRNKIFLSKQKNSSTHKRKRFSSLFSMSFMMILLALTIWQCREDDFTGEVVGVCPKVTLTNPVNGAVNVVSNKQITATFNEAMDPATINETTFTLKKSGNLITGTVTYSGTTATFIPADLLDANSVYTATVKRESKDLMGSIMVKDTTWNFNTGSAPIVVLTNPTDGASDVALNKVITADFSTAMNATSINTSSFIVMQGATAISGTVTYSGNTATFSPVNVFVANKVYSATIKKAAKDIAGNAMIKDTTWSFATGTLPIITVTHPQQGNTNVPLETKVTATFSKMMNITTINAATFTLKQGTTTVSGLVTYEDMTATFTPTSSLLYDVEYTATITTGAKDLSNKSIPADSTWKFRTGILVLPILPYVVSTDPANADINVALDKVITATFSKVMDNSTINSSTFKLMNGTTPVLGFVTYTGNNGIFTPVSPLLPGVTYDASISTGAKDLDGNSLATEKKWSFTTIALGAQYTVSLSSNPPAGGTTSGGGLFNAGASVTAIATANTDYTFTNWTENGIIVSPLATYVFTLNSNRNLVANFISSKMTVSLSSNPLLSGTTTGAGLFSSGSLVTVSATPNTNYQFSNWTENGLIVSLLPNYSFNITADRTLVANFTAIQYTVSVSANPFAGGNVNGGGLFNAGTQITVIATANAGFTFEKWTDGGNEVSTLANYTFTLNNNRTLVANFKAIQYTVSISANPFAGGSVNGGGLFNAGTPVTVIATANAGYAFEKWTVGGDEVSISANYTFTLNSNRTLVANFAAIISGPPGVDLGSAGNFAILAGSGISNTGVTTKITGNVGSFPTATINGLLSGNVIGILYTVADPIVGLAKTDLTTAYNDAQGRSTSAISLPGQLGGLTLAPGLYVNSSTSGISGTGANGILTLDAGGNPNSVWIFKMGSTLITDAGTSIVLAGGAQAKNIYWSVGTSATLGTNSIFFGNILADQSITLTTGANLTGRALTRIGAVTLDTNTVTKP